MSAGDDDLFTRWSRRKQAVRLKEAEEAAAAEEQAALPVADPEPEEPSVPDPEEPVPSLDDLTPDGDLSAFMRGGVPPALRNAAMRKMWSLDPAIRDHVGLAENSWNFNEPGAMPGFGPLAAGRAVVGFLSTVTREAPADPDETPAAAEAPSSALESPPTPESAALPESAESPPPEEQVDSPDTADDPGEVATEVAAATEAPEAAGDEDSARAVSRPRHGGALPR